MTQLAENLLFSLPLSEKRQQIGEILESNDLIASFRETVFLEINQLFQLFIFTLDFNSHPAQWIM